MKSRTIFLLLFAISLLSACELYPTTPGGFRKAMQAHANLSATHIEKFVVNRSLRSTVEFVKHRADACLNLRLTSTEHGDYGSVTRRTAIVAPHMTLSAHKGEIYITETFSHNKIFMIVADYIRLSHNKTRVELYYQWGTNNARVARAFRVWSKGEHGGCPDLS